MPAPIAQYALNTVMRDVANATTNSTVRVVVPFTGKLLKVTAVLGAAKTGDAILTVSRNATALTPTITLTASGSAANSTFSADYNQQVVAGDVIVIASDGGGSEAIDTVLVGLTLTLTR